MVVGVTEVPDDYAAASYKDVVLGVRVKVDAADYFTGETDSMI